MYRNIFIPILFGTMTKTKKRKRKGKKIMIIWKALIRDELGNVKYRSPDFNKKWIAVKWASKIIDKHKKLNEWFYEVWCE